MTDEIEGYIDLFEVDNPEGKRPHYKGFVKVNGIRYGFACWPAKSGKAGVYSGTLKLEQPKPDGFRREAEKVMRRDDDQGIPF